MPNIFDVAHYILQTRGSTPPIKLQILCYYAQARHLARTDGTALFMQDFVANPTCPLCPELEAIKSKHYLRETTDIPPDKLSGTLTQDQKQIIDRIVATHGMQSIQTMAGITRIEEPWLKAVAPWKALSQTPPAPYPTISKDSMYEHYA